MSDTAALTPAAPDKTAAAVVTAPLVVLDEKSRCAGLYGPIFERLEIEPVYAWGQTTEQVMALKPVAILLSSEWTDFMRLTAAAARRANIPVIYVVDGAMGMVVSLE